MPGSGYSEAGKIVSATVSTYWPLPIRAHRRGHGEHRRSPSPARSRSRPRALARPSGASAVRSSDSSHASLEGGRKVQLTHDASDPAGTGAGSDGRGGRPRTSSSCPRAVPVRDLPACGSAHRCTDLAAGGTRHKTRNLRRPVGRQLRRLALRLERPQYAGQVLLQLASCPGGHSPQHEGGPGNRYRNPVRRRRRGRWDVTFTTSSVGYSDVIVNAGKPQGANLAGGAHTHEVPPPGWPAARGDPQRPPGVRHRFLGGMNT